MADTSSPIINIISEKWVKPSSPTPPSSKYYKLSIIDRSITDRLTPVAFFYPKERFLGGNSSRTELFELLETSLSKTLTYYYPFAGRFMDDNITIDCNDSGVELWEAQIQGSMFEILNHPTNCNAKDLVFPRGINCCNSTFNVSFVTIQLSLFECGGICVAICLSHNLGDAQTLSNFVNDWAFLARGISRDIININHPPIFPGTSIFPSLDIHPSSEKTNTISTTSSSSHITRRFVFSAIDLSRLKKLVTIDSEIKDPSRVEVVTALMFKTARSSLLSSGGAPNPSSLMQVVNYRPLTTPPLSERLVGNFVSRFLVTNTYKYHLSTLVTELRKSKEEFKERYKLMRPERNSNDNKFVIQFSSFVEEGEKGLLLKGIKDSDMYKCSSWCRFGFYEVDFGWGKPIFAFMFCGLLENTFVLMDSPNGDGIEAFVTLQKDQMLVFEQDEELLTFASLNPDISTENL